MSDVQGPGSQWRPVCFAVQADDKADSAGVKLWLQSKQIVKLLDLSDQGVESATGPTADSVTAAKQAAAKAGVDFVLSHATKAAAVQQAFQADKSAALTSEHEARVKREADAAANVKAAEEEANRTSADHVLAAGRASETDGAEDPALTAATKAHDAAKVALLKAKQAHQAAHASLQQPCLLQQPYWCDGAGTDPAALAAWHQAELPLRAVVYLRASAEGAEPAPVPPLVTELRAVQQQCDPTHPLADLAILELNIGDPNPLFTPLKTPQVEDPKPAADLAGAAAAAKGSAKGPAAKAPAAKAPAAAKTAAAAIDQPPPVGAAELGRALELLGLQVQEYYAWREGATVVELPAEQTNADDLTCLAAAFNGTEQEQTSTATILDAIIQQLGGTASPPHKLAESAGGESSSSRFDAVSSSGQSASSTVVPSCVVYEGDMRLAAEAGILTGCAPRNHPHKVQAVVQSQSGSSKARVTSLHDLDFPAALIRARRAGPSQDALQAAGAARTALRAQCTEVSLETVERYNLLKRFLAMLPASLQAACEAPVLARQHVEYLDAPVMTQTLSRATASCPGLHVQEYAEEEALLVACCGGIAEDNGAAALQRLQPFCEVWNAFVGSGETRSLRWPLVYGLQSSQIAATPPRKHVWPREGSVVSSDEHQRITVRAGAQVLSLQQQPVRQVTCTNAAGASLCCLVRSHAGDSSPPEAVSVQCVPLSGVVTELTADGQVIFADSNKPSGPLPSGRGVATHGAPLADGDIQALLKDSQPSWRSVLSSGEVTQAYQSGRIRILSLDGSVREHWPSGCPEAPIQTAPVWLRTSPTGQRWLEYDEVQGSDALQPGSAPADAAEATATDSANTTPSQNPSTQSAPHTGSSIPASEPLPPSADPPGPAGPPPALPKGPQPLEPLSSATVTDPDSGANVTTRSDLMMIIDYATKDRVVQDSDGTRVTSYASGGFMVESAGLPDVTGTSAGVSVTPVPGLTMQWAAADQSICVNLDQVAQLVCLGSVVTFLNSELTTGQQTTSALSVSQLCKAVATASTTKAAEVARQIAESQKVLDVQNAAAAEQHVKAMAEYEAQLAEAAAAWEAEKKKKKGKAKDEPAPAPPPAPVAPIPQVAQGTPDPMGLADTVATAAPGWFAFDLRVGSMAYQDAAKDGCHITFDSDKQLSGWQPSSSPWSALSLRPRFFVVYQDGSGYEVLDNDLYAAYAWRQSQKHHCRVTESDVINAPEPGTKSISFMTRHDLRGSDVPELPLAEVGLVRSAAPPAAVPALQPPSQVVLPSPQQTLVMPRVATFAPQQSRDAQPAAVYSFRQITRFPAFTPDTSDAITAALKAFTALQLKQSQARPGTYTVTDPRTLEEQAAAAELSSRLAKLRTEQQSSASQAELQEQQASVSKVAGEAAAEEEVRKPVKQKKPRTPKVGLYDHTKHAPAKGSTLGYWQAEEGLKAADYMQQNPSQHQLPPIEDRNHPGRHVEGATDDSRGNVSLQETSATDSSHVIEEEEGEEDVADGQGHNSGAREAAGIPALQLGGRSHLGMPNMYHMQGGRQHQQQQQASPTRSTAIRDVYGRLRSPAAAPHEATSGQNLPYIQANEEALNMTRTSSASLVRMQGKATKQFMLTPGHLDFGTIKIGQVVEKTACLLNVSLERARFTVHRPRPPLQVSCATGPLAAGMHTTIKVIFTGQTLGDYVGSLHLTSELNTFTVSISARVVPAVSSLESQDSMFAAMSLGAASRMSLGNVSRGSISASPINRSSLVSSPDVRPPLA